MVLGYFNIFFVTGFLAITQQTDIEEISVSWYHCADLIVQNTHHLYRQFKQVDIESDASYKEAIR